MQNVNCWFSSCISLRILRSRSFRGDCHHHPLLSLLWVLWPLWGWWCIPPPPHAPPPLFTIPLPPPRPRGPGKCPLFPIKLCLRSFSCRLRYNTTMEISITIQAIPEWRETAISLFIHLNMHTLTLTSQHKHAHIHISSTAKYSPQSPLMCYTYLNELLDFIFMAVLQIQTWQLTRLHCYRLWNEVKRERRGSKAWSVSNSTPQTRILREVGGGINQDIQNNICNKAALCVSSHNLRIEVLMRKCAIFPFSLYSFCWVKCQQPVQEVHSRRIRPIPDSRVNGKEYRCKNQAK